jgi:hypothetical protein
MPWWLRIKWWFEEQKSKVPAWMFFVLGILLRVPDLFDATNFWIEAVKAMGGKVGLIASVIDSPWFSIALILVGIAWLYFVGESPRPVRRPVLPLLGWVLAVVVSLVFWSVLVAGYVATHIPQQMTNEAKAQINSLTQAKQQLQEKVTALEQQTSPRVLTEAQLKKMVETLKKVPAGTSHRVIFEALSSCNECAGFMGDIMAAWKDLPGWQVQSTVHFGLNPRLRGVIVGIDSECPSTEAQLISDVLGAGEISHSNIVMSNEDRKNLAIPAGFCPVFIGVKP